MIGKPPVVKSYVYDSAYNLRRESLLPTIIIIIQVKILIILFIA